MSCDHGKGDSYFWISCHVGNQGWGPRNKRHRKPKGQSRMDNPEKLAILGTQNTGRRQTKQRKHNTSCVGHHYAQTNTKLNTIRHYPSYKQLEVKTNPTSLLCGNRNGHHNKEVRT
jgi:hypothetical protein